MIKVYVKKQSNYPVKTPEIKKKLASFFKDQGIVSDADCVVAFVGKSVMMDLARRYLGENNKIHDVLTFPENEVDRSFAKVEDNIIHLGEIVICYPQVFEEAKREERLIRDKTYELIEHGAWHLLGKHHNEI